MQVFLAFSTACLALNLAHFPLQLTYPLDMLRFRIAVDPWASLSHVTNPNSSPSLALSQLTYPLDMLRFRIAVDPSVRTIGGAVATLLREGRGAAFYRGLGASLLGEGPGGRGLWLTMGRLCGDRQ